MLVDKRYSKYNSYDEHEDYIEVHCNNNKGERVASFMIDKEDKDILKYKWCISDYKYKYVKNNAKLNARLEYYMLDVDKDLNKIIFINDNVLDFRRNNLKVITIKEYREQFKMNMNRSGYTGVSFDKSKNKYRAYITIDTRRINLGTYANKEDAINARKRAEKLYF